MVVASSSSSSGRLLPIALALTAASASFFAYKLLCKENETAFDDDDVLVARGDEQLESDAAGNDDAAEEEENVENVKDDGEEDDDLTLKSANNDACAADVAFENFDNKVTTYSCIPFCDPFSSQLFGILYCNTTRFYSGCIAKACSPSLAPTDLLAFHNSCSNLRLPMDKSLPLCPHMSCLHHRKQAWVHFLFDY